MDTLSELAMCPYGPVGGSAHLLSRAGKEAHAERLGDRVDGSCEESLEFRRGSSRISSGSGHKRRTRVSVL